MIGIVDVSIQAHNVSMPLYPMRAFEGSPSSIRVRSVPKKIGNWQINKVYFAVAYPDNTTQTIECKLVGGVYVGTIAGCNTVGNVQNGYSIYADGVDENGNAVTNYCLGKGDIQILDARGITEPLKNTKFVQILSSEPATPNEGDMWQTSGAWYVWQDGEAWAIGDDSGRIDELSADLSTKLAIADFNDFKTNEFTPKIQNLSNEITALNGNMTAARQDIETISANYIDRQTFTSFKIDTEQSIESLSSDKLDASTFNSFKTNELTTYALSANVQNELATKADASSLTAYALSDDVNAALNTVDGQITNINQTKADTSSLTAYALSDDVSASLADKRNYVDLSYVRHLDYSKPQEILGFSLSRSATITITLTKITHYSENVWRWESWDANGADTIWLDLTDSEHPIFIYGPSTTYYYTTFTIPDGATSFSHTFDFTGTGVMFTISLLTEDVIALRNDNISQFRNDADYITKEQVTPAGLTYAGWALKSRVAMGMLTEQFLYSATGTYPYEALSSMTRCDFGWLGYDGGALRIMSYQLYPWILSALSGTSFNPAIEMKWGYQYLRSKKGSRIQTIWQGPCWKSPLIDGTTTYMITNACDRFYIITGDPSGTGFYTSSSYKTITLASGGLSVETYDGQTEQIVCTRQDTINTTTPIVHYVAFEDDLSAKADVSALTAYALSTDVANELTNYLPLSGGTLTNQTESVEIGPWGMAFQNDFTLTSTGGGTYTFDVRMPMQAEFQTFVDRYTNTSLADQLSTLSSSVNQLNGKMYDWQYAFSDCYSSMQPADWMYSDYDTSLYQLGAGATFNTTTGIWSMYLIPIADPGDAFELTANGTEESTTLNFYSGTHQVSVTATKFYYQKFDVFTYKNNTMLSNYYLSSMPLAIGNIFNKNANMADFYVTIDGTTLTSDLSILFNSRYQTSVNKYHPKTAASSDFMCKAGCWNVYHMTEYRSNNYLVERWIEQ